MPQEIVAIRPIITAAITIIIIGIIIPPPMERKKLPAICYSILGAVVHVYHVL